ncbi:MAG: glycosyl hydrolase family 38 [Isosphaeraceae bacterium]
MMEDDVIDESNPEDHAPVAEPAVPTIVLSSLIPYDGEEPPPALGDTDALAVWAVVSTPWHPALLARLADLPRIEPLDSPYTPGPDEVRIVPAGMISRLPSEYPAGADNVGVIEGDVDRLRLARRLLDRIDPGATLDEPLDPIVLDFFALGTARWMLRNLTVAMGHPDNLDLSSLTRETLAGANAWRAGDHAAATNRLRAAFELLTQARERFYPVDAYVVDLCLLDPNTPPEGFASLFEARAPFTLLAPAKAIEALAERAPDHVVALLKAIDEGWADVAGGAYTEVDEPLLPWESIFWQFRKGSAVYCHHLEGRDVETLARRRFGLYPQLPQIAKRLGYRFALHLGFDAGKFPIPPEAKRLWESPDGSYLETLTRPPMAADRPSQGMMLPWRLAKSMKDDHVATLPLVHWPTPVASWFTDLRRVAAYSPVLARWVTLGDYFSMTDRPFEAYRPEVDDYITPYLAQAVARRDPSPISGRVDHARLRARFDGLNWMKAVALTLTIAGPESDQAESQTDPCSEGDGQGEGDSPPQTPLEEVLETGRFVEARTELDRWEPAWTRALARGIVGTTETGRPGYLVLNPLGIARKAVVLLPDAAADLRPEGPLLVAQFTDEGVWAVVDLPAFGYAWVPRQTEPGAAPAAAGALSGREQILRNETLEVEINKDTGGIRSFRVSGEPTARMGQQLVIAGLVGPDGQPASSKMLAEGFEIEYGGPALVQAVSRGVIVDPRDDRPLARFRQRFRLWSGRPVLDLEITLTDLDSAWLDQIASADPWNHFLACRWAWPDSNSMLQRTCLLAPEVTRADHPETPDAIDVSTRRHRTALLFGGLAHHRRHGERMLDTLLIAGRESARQFRLGVGPDLDHPFHASLDMNAPALVVPVESGPPGAGAVGWFFKLDHKAIAVTRVEVIPESEGRGRGIIFHLVETAGHAARCRLRLVHDPDWAHQTDLQGDLIVDLTVEHDAVLIDMTPHEMMQVEVIFR